MAVTKCLGIAVVLMGIAGALVLAQQNSPVPPVSTIPSANPAGTPAPKPARVLPPPPAGNLVAARVNGLPIPELAVYRLLAQNPNENRKDALDFLIENALVDQYLLQLKINVDPVEVDKRVQQMKDEAAKEKQDWNKLLASMYLTEDDLRQQLAAVLRWDLFTDRHATDKALRELFDKQRSIFDGSQMQARHILITLEKTGLNADQVKAKLLTLRKQVEDDAAGEVAKLPAGTSKLDQEKARMQALTKAFAEAATKVSECPSKEMGGDLGWFPRSGIMVEPFARAAFALKPYQMSDPVVTEFGYHLILVIDAKPGKEVRYEDIRPSVREVFCDRVRDAVITALKPRAQIVIEPEPK